MFAEHRCQVNLFAKSPLPGQVKTRLAQHIGEASAAALARELILWSVDLVQSSWPGRVMLHAWPNGRHAVFRKVLELHGVPVAAQVPGDLGQKMATVLMQDQPGVLTHAVMGCDIPHLPSAVLAEAHDAMMRGKTVVGPATDGGFYFFATPGFRPALFHNIEWGGAKVYRRLMENLDNANINCIIRLPIMTDLDRWEDLLEVADGFTPLARYLSTSLEESGS